MRQKVKILVLGAGPAGLGAGYRLRELGEKQFLIAEQQPRVGGLASSFVDEQGFTWDIGGHVQFSHYKYFDDVMDRALGRDGWLEHQRESWVWMHDRFIPYPFQNNIRYLPREILWRCLKGIIDVTRTPSSAPTNFREWILSIFGSGIAEEFMLPYNFKVWAYPLEELAFQWIGERVSVVDVARVAENIILEKDDLSWGPNNLFRFPKSGGTGAIWDAVGNLVGREHVLLNTGVTGIDPGTRVATLSNGDEIEYEQLLSTIPIDRLSQMVRSFPTDLTALAAGLKHSSSHIVGIGLRGKPSRELATKCWMYFPETNCPFYRVTLFSNYSPANVPNINEHFSLMAETSESPQKPVDANRIVEQTIEGLRNTRLIDDSHEVVSRWHYRAEYGYPTPSVERDAILSQVIPALEARGIFSRGRFGAWQYEVSNQDHTFMQGVEWANRITAGEAESTFRLRTVLAEMLHTAHEARGTVESLQVLQGDQKKGREPARSSSTNNF